MAGRTGRVSKPDTLRSYGNVVAMLCTPPPPAAPQAPLAGTKPSGSATTLALTAALSAESLDEEEDVPVRRKSPIQRYNNHIHRLDQMRQYELAVAEWERQQRQLRVLERSQRTDPPGLEWPQEVEASDSSDTANLDLDVSLPASPSDASLPDLFSGASLPASLSEPTPESTPESSAQPCVQTEYTPTPSGCGKRVTFAI